MKEKFNIVGEGNRTDRENLVIYENEKNIIVVIDKTAEPRLSGQSTSLTCATVGKSYVANPVNGNYRAMILTYSEHFPKHMKKAIKQYNEQEAKNIKTDDVQSFLAQYKKKGK